MQNIRVGINFHNRRVGDIIQPKDRDYATFAMWAEKQSRHKACVICEYDGETKEQAKEAGSFSEDGTFIPGVPVIKEPQKPVVAPPTVYKCNHCEYETTNPKDYHGHRLGAHKDKLRKPKAQVETPIKDEEIIVGADDVSAPAEEDVTNGG